MIGFYLLMFLGLTSVQIVIFPYFLKIEGCYDLLIPLISFRAIYKPGTESLFLTLLTGFLIDNLSGCPLGLYSTAYVWLYIVIRRLQKYIKLNSWFILTGIVVSGVFIENILLIMLIFISEPARQSVSFIKDSMIHEVLWAAITGAILLEIIYQLSKKWNSWINKFVVQQN